MVVVIAAAGDPLRILTAQLALLPTTTLAAGGHAGLHRLLPGALETFSPIQSIAGALRIGLAHVDVCRHKRQNLLRAARLNGLGIFSAQLALLSAAALANGVHARGHAGRDGVLVLPAELTLLPAAAATLAFDAIVHGLCCDRRHQAQHEHASHGMWYIKPISKLLRAQGQLLEPTTHIEKGV